MKIVIVCYSLYHCKYIIYIICRGNYYNTIPYLCYFLYTLLCWYKSFYLYTWKQNFFELNKTILILYMSVQTWNCIHYCTVVIKSNHQSYMLIEFNLKSYPYPNSSQEWSLVACCTWYCVLCIYRNIAVSDRLSSIIRTGVWRIGWRLWSRWLLNRYYPSSGNQITRQTRLALWQCILGY